MESLAGPQALRLVEEVLGDLAREAHAFRFAVAPNPCVGAAVLSGGRVVASGYHREWGGAHAEVEAFETAARAGIAAASWEALVVTLEPCSSQGKTAPCVDAILATPVPVVFVGALDPDPRHRGEGVEQLRKAGREVITLEGAAPLEELAPHFLRWNELERRRRPRPWTIAKWAQTRSGHLVPTEGEGLSDPSDSSAIEERVWISGPESRSEVHALRARVDAIVTGIGTVLADDPRLTVRAPGKTQRPPARVVLDSSLRTPPRARLFLPPSAGEAAGEVHLLSVPGGNVERQRALIEAGAQVHGLRGEDRLTLNLREVQTWLWDHGFQRVLLEAGPTLLAAYLDSGFVDQVLVYTGEARGGRGESLGSRLAEARLLERVQRECGRDSVLEGFLASG